MRHHVKGKKLNRDVGHRRALYKNLVSALIIHGTIETTQAKAKAIKGMVDKLMTKAKANTLASRRQIDKVLNQTSLVNRMVDVIAPATGKRTSGFTRIVKLGKRAGDDAFMVRLEFVDKVVSAKTEAPAKKSEPKKEAKKETKKAADKKPAATTKAPRVDKTKKPAGGATPVKAGMIRQKSGDR